MNILFLLIGVSLIAALVFLILFLWAVRSGQYDDTYTPSVRVLFDDEAEDNMLSKENNNINDKQHLTQRYGDSDL